MQLLTHFFDDPNAPKHMWIGAVAAVIAWVLAIVMGYATVACYIAPLGALLAGIGIEVVQRIQRRGGVQNTVTESMLDAWVTFCGGLFMVVVIMCSRD